MELSEYNKIHSDLYAGHVKQLDTAVKEKVFVCEKGYAITVVDFNKIVRDLVNKLTHYEAQQKTHGK